MKLYAIYLRIAQFIDPLVHDLLHPVDFYKDFCYLFSRTTWNIEVGAVEGIKTCILPIALLLTMDNVLRALHNRIPLVPVALTLTALPNNLLGRLLQSYLSKEILWRDPAIFLRLWPTMVAGSFFSFTGGVHLWRFLTALWRRTRVPAKQLRHAAP